MQSLIQTKLGKYLLYAAGEIVLVVIGILIALKVNTYNQAQANQEKFEKIFEEIQDNLEQDILRAENTIVYYNTKDSLIQLVIEEQVTPQMFRDNSNLFYLLYYYQGFKLTDNGYNLLSLELDQVPEKYKEVMPYLHAIYKGSKPFFELINDNIIDFTYRMLERWSLNHSYYTLTEEEKIAFFMNSKAFRNDAMLYGRYAQDSFVRNLHVYVYHALKVYTMLLELESNGDYDLASVFLDRFGELDTIQLSDRPEQDLQDFDPLLVETLPIYKKTVDRSNLFIRNNSDIPVKVRSEVDDEFVPGLIGPGETAYARPIVGADYQFLYKGGNYLGTHSGVKRNALLVLP